MTVWDSISGRRCQQFTDSPGDIPQKILIGLAARQGFAQPFQPDQAIVPAHSGEILCQQSPHSLAEISPSGPGPQAADKQRLPLPRLPEQKPGQVIPSVALNP